MQKIALLAGASLGALGVMIGAFGAHAWRAALEAQQRMETFETAVKYQFYHALALILIGILMYNIQHRLLKYASWSMIAGILIFSGSLYVLCWTHNARWGAVTPIGGVLLILGWALLLVAIVKNL
ncbi:MAG: DUF423 domain-containing protein [Cyclobacteriaceae bacterium]